MRNDQSFGTFLQRKSLVSQHFSQYYTHPPYPPKNGSIQNYEQMNTEKGLPRIEVFSKGYLLDANNYGEPFLQKKARHQRDSKPPHCRGVFIIEVFISRCPSMRASNYTKFGVFGTKRTVMGASVL